MNAPFSDPFKGPVPILPNRMENDYLELKSTYIRKEKMWDSWGKKRER
jgi:hypothetical protein